MGAINYKTSKYITLAIEPYDISDFTSDDVFMRELNNEVEEYGGTVDESIEAYINSLYEEDYSNAECELEKLNVQYFNVSIQNGYYDGFSIDIDPNFLDDFNSWEEKRDAQKEVTKIKEFLINCANMGFVACYPHWCTTYLSREETIKEIAEAVKEMRADIKKTPTWSTKCLQTTC